MDDDEIDADTYEELTAKVVQCREDLQKFLAMRLKKKSGLAAFRDQYLPGFDPVELAIGGSDGLAMKYTMASCDKNGDGKIKADELEKLQESSANILSAQTEAQMNAGVVAALILSFMVPLSLEPIEASDDCADFFGQDAVKYLRIVSIIFTTLANVYCIATIILAVRFGLYVNWIPSAPGRTLFVSTLDAALFPRLQIGTLNSMMLAIIARGTLVGPLQGLAGIVTLILYFVVLNGAEQNAGARAKSIQLRLVKDMMKIG